MTMRLPVLLFAALAAVALAHAAPRRFRSGATRTHLLELYSSEGCSSCPAAEAGLGRLRDAPGLWRDFVPVSFHVTYWDYLGWRDRFARREFTERQYRYAESWGTGNVYTPCFVLDGADGGARLDADRLQPSRAPAGELEAELADDGAVAVTFAPARRDDYFVTVAWLGGGIVSPVRAGENSGRTLRHDFVALALAQAPLRDGHAVVQLPLAGVDGVTRRALAVWITRRGEPAPVQAAGGWVD